MAKKASEAIKPTRTHELYGGAVTIDFYEKYGKYDHVYINRATGEWLQSVTGATGILNKPALLPWACGEMADYLVAQLQAKKKLTPADIYNGKTAWRDARDAAANKGTAAHDLISQYVLAKLGRGEPPKMPKDEQVVNCLFAFQDWAKAHDVEFLDSERLVYSRAYNFVGTLDLLMRMGGVKAVGDNKTGSGIYAEHIYQVGGYGLGYNEENDADPARRGVIINLGKEDASFRVVEFDLSNKLVVKGFLSCLFLKGAAKDVAAIAKS